MQFLRIMTAVSAVALATSAFATEPAKKKNEIGSGGGSQIKQIGGSLGTYATGAASAEGVVDVNKGKVSNTSSTGTVNGTALGVAGGLNGSNLGGVGAVGVGGTSYSNNTISATDNNGKGDVFSATNATNASGTGAGIGGSYISSSGYNYAYTTGKAKH
jgi:hypothetical protein